MNFEKFNFAVVPVGENKRPYVAWSDPDTWCDWEERELVYPKNPTGDWYVIPGCKKTYQINGVEFGVFVIDIDNENHQDFKDAVELVRSWGVPRTLTVRTKHGGLHLYYLCLADKMPRNCNLRATNNLPIEIKSNVGWVAPNGRDRLVIVDEPIAMLNVEEGTPFGDAVDGCHSTRKEVVQKEIDPNFPIEKIPIPDVGKGYRHNKMLGTVRWLRENGCPKEKAMAWAEEFYAKNGRTPQQHEFENAWNWDSQSDADILVKQNPISHPSKPEKRHTEPLTKPQSLLNGDVLAGIDKAEALFQFADKDERVTIVSELFSDTATANPTDLDFLSDLMADTIDEMKQAWTSATRTQQVAYVKLKDMWKLILKGE